MPPPARSSPPAPRRPRSPGNRIAQQLAPGVSLAITGTFQNVIVPSAASDMNEVTAGAGNTQIGPAVVTIASVQVQVVDGVPTATVTTNSQLPQDIAPGATVDIAGLTGAASVLNGTYQVIAASGESFTFQASVQSLPATSFQTSQGVNIPSGTVAAVVDGQIVDGGTNTFIGGSGNDTLVAGTGSDSLVAGSGNTDFAFNQDSNGPVVIAPAASDPAGSVNTLDFLQYGSGIDVNLGSTLQQSLGGGGASHTMVGGTGNDTLSTAGGSLMLTLLDGSEINAVIDSAFNDDITGNSAGDTFYLGARNDTITGGGGSDTFYFSGNNLGSDVLNESGTAGDTLNFYGFGGPIGTAANPFSLSSSATQVLASGASSSLSLTLTNPDAFNTVIASHYADYITGNDDANETIIGGGGLGSFMAGSGNDYVQGYFTTVVYLDFPAAVDTPNDEHVYTPLEEQSILQGLESIYSDYNYFFTLNQQSAAEHGGGTGRRVHHRDVRCAGGGRRRQRPRPEPPRARGTGADQRQRLPRQRIRRTRPAHQQ